ncbi:metal-dependent hydrolase [Desulfitibacter alkalitolerans]|uniref:metal-dependent hydrolase n=1 Tax=Desulfitibacter alkalitolerans TaxID=264641 RepID=UPI00047F6ED7|nr:metal-dependent hydrolase [Desulfitibacter alkalitolerans]
MDPLTHALAGALTASFSGNPMSITDPIFLGAVLGSMAPDLDIIYQTKGDVAYLKNHRGFSHSFIGFAAVSAGIAGFLSLMFPETAFLTIFLWTLLGALTHGFLDFLNSYGAKLFWPLIKKKQNLGILTIFDPILMFIMGAGLAGQVFYPMANTIGAVCMVGYLSFRLYMRMKAAVVVKRRYPNFKKVVVIPSVISIWNWHFLLENDNNITVGEIRFLSWAMKIRRSYRKQINHPVVQAALKSKLGRLFKDFTPIFHVSVQRKDDSHLVSFIDLRYFIRDDFMHHATGILNEEFQLMEGIFQPYNKNRKIKIAG